MSFIIPLLFLWDIIVKNQNLYIIGSDNVGDFLIKHPFTNFLSFWQNSTVVGEQELHIKFMQLPTKIYYLLFNHFGDNFSAFLFKILVLLLLTAAFFSFRRLLSLITEEKLIRNILALFYVLNITTLTILHWQPINLYLFFFAFSPFFIYQLFIYLKTKEQNNKNVYLLLLANFLLLPGISNAALMFIILAVSALILIYFFIKKQVTYQKIIILIFFVLMNLFWFVPLAYESLQLKNIQNTAGFQLQTAQSISVDNANNTPIHLLELIGGWGYFNKWTDGKPVITFSSFFSGLSQIVLLIPILTLISLYFFKKPKKIEIFFIAILILISLIFMAQTTPFGFIYSTIIKFPGFVAFRSTFTKLGPLIIALVACLLAFRSAFSKKFSMIITFSLGIYLVFMSLIPLTGTTIRDFLYQKDITAITTLNHAVAQGESAIVLPFPTYGIYRFRTNDGKEMWIPPEIFNNALPDRKILSLGYGNSSYSDNFLQKIQKTDQNGVYVGDSFWGDINLLGINKIVIDKTYYDPFNKNYNYQNIENALIEKGLPKVYESNQFTVYKNIGEIKPLIAGADITNINTISPTEYQIEIPKDKGQKLEFQQTYGAWKLYETSDKLPILGFLFSKEITNNHKFDNKFANSWIIGNTDLNRSNDKDVKITIYYKPQDYINLGFFISFLSLVGLILYLNIFRTKTNRDC